MAPAQLAPHKLSCATQSGWRQLRWCQLRWRKCGRLAGRAAAAADSCPASPPRSRSAGLRLGSRSTSSCSSLRRSWRPTRAVCFIARLPALMPTAPLACSAFYSNVAANPTFRLSFSASCRVCVCVLVVGVSFSRGWESFLWLALKEAALSAPVGLMRSVESFLVSAQTAFLFLHFSLRFHGADCVLFSAGRSLTHAVAIAGAAARRIPVLQDPWSSMSPASVFRPV